MKSGHEMFHHPGVVEASQRRNMLMPAISPYIIEPIWQQLSALLPRTQADHPLGCHRPAYRIE